jgi:hypothetical protein
MIKETIRSIFKFLENEENRKTPIVWKIVNNEPIEQDDLIVNGDIDMEYSDVESLPEGLYVNGDLSLFGSEIKSLPKDLYVGENLSLGYCDNITSLPEGLYVGGNLSIAKTNISSLPKGLKVEGFLFIRYTPLVNFSDEELIKMIKPKDDVDGYINRKIIRE